MVMHWRRGVGLPMARWQEDCWKISPRAAFAKEGNRYLPYGKRSGGILL
jgi:hypothetical protein